MKKPSPKIHLNFRVIFILIDTQTEILTTFEHISIVLKQALSYLSLIGLFVFIFYPIQAQELTVQERINKIDTLFYYNGLLSAQKEIQALEALFQEAESPKLAWILQVKYQKAWLLHIQEQYSQSSKLCLEIIEQAQQHYPIIEYKTRLLAALIYEISDNYPLSNNHLNEAYHLYKKHNLAHLYSSYCVRRSSYYRLIGQPDSSLFLAHTAVKYAQKYNNPWELSDAYLLLGMLLPSTQYQKAIDYSLKAMHMFIPRNDYGAVAAMYINITSNYLKNQEIKQAYLYNDSAITFSKNYVLHDDLIATIYKQRSIIFQQVGNLDSALFYFKMYHAINLKVIQKKESTEVKKITELYENEKNKIIIQGKDTQLAWIISLLTIIVGISILLFRSNKKIRHKNKTIQEQLIDLGKVIEQKQVILAELQHRVKNNLQQVISILEMQKESIHLNNIDELIRENQNRIYSMALLHKKLEIWELVNEVDLHRYIIELSALVRDSYCNHFNPAIHLHIVCELKKIKIEKALPLGLIIVELISNSMKYAFPNQAEGQITIQILSEEEQNKLYYADNGIGFDWNSSNTQGLGMEIIMGLVEQLDATIESKSHMGFELSIYFK